MEVWIKRYQRRGTRDYQEELQREYDFYMAQKMLETMFMFGMISVDEFHKISAQNRKTFSPILAEIMP